MKRSVISGFLSLLGSFWIAIILQTASANLVDGWDPEKGRLLSTIIDQGLLLPLILGILVAGCGLVTLIVEYFRKGD